DKPLKVKNAIATVATNAAFNVPVKSGRNTVALSGKSGSKTETIVVYLDVTAAPQAQAIRGDLSGAALLGTEFTFTDDDMINAAKQEGAGATSTEVSRAMQQKWVDKMRTYPDFAITEKPSKYEGDKVYTMTDLEGWWYSVSTDPGVIETQTKPMTLNEAKG